MIYCINLPCELLRDRVRRTARGLSCPWHFLGQVLGQVLPQKRPGTRGWATPLPWQGPGTRDSLPPPKKGPGTRGWLPAIDIQTENITFPHP